MKYVFFKWKISEVMGMDRSVVSLLVVMIVVIGFKLLKMVSVNSI